MAVFFCILGLLMRTHEKVVRQQTKGRRQYAGERKRMSAVAAKPILLPLPKTAVRKGGFFLHFGAVDENSRESGSTTNERQTQVCR